MINYSELSSEELKKWNTQLREQIAQAKKGWLTQMLQHWSDMHQSVKEEMRKRGLVYSILKSEQ